MKTIGVLGALLLFGFAYPGRAADITYSVDESVGPGFVTGTISTDGAIGTLGTGDIVNWNLNVNDGTDGTFDIEGPLSGNNSGVQVAGSDLTSTATQLFFNFDGADGGFLAFETPGIGDDGPFIGYNAQFAGFDSPQSINISSDFGESTIIDPTFTGNQVIASTPEPSSLSLFALGLVGLLFAGIRLRGSKASMTA
jgi:hypothetical protein